MAGEVKVEPWRGTLLAIGAAVGGVVRGTLGGASAKV